MQRGKNRDFFLGPIDELSFDVSWMHSNWTSERYPKFSNRSHLLCQGFICALKTFAVLARERLLEYPRISSREMQTRSVICAILQSNFKEEEPGMVKIEGPLSLRRKEELKNYETGSPLVAAQVRGNIAPSWAKSGKNDTVLGDQARKMKQLRRIAAKAILLSLWRFSSYVVLHSL